MSRASSRWVLTVTIAGVLLFQAAPATADHLEVEASDPPTVRVGEVVELNVVVRSSETRAPVEGATVVALRQATIVGVAGDVEIARSTTDENGMATLHWQVRAAPTESVVLAYSQIGDVTIESEPLPVLAVGPGPQIVRSESGVRIPGLGAWVLVSLLVGVWGLIQFSMLGPVRVALAESEAAAEVEAPGEVEQP